MYSLSQNASAAAVDNDFVSSEAKQQLSSGELARTLRFPPQFLEEE